MSDEGKESWLKKRGGGKNCKKKLVHLIHRLLPFLFLHLRSATDFRRMAKLGEGDARWIVEVRMCA